MYNINTSYRLGCCSTQSVREGSFPSADFGRGNVQERKGSASKSALLFFAAFFCRSKRKQSMGKPDVNRENIIIQSKLQLIPAIPLTRILLLILTIQPICLLRLSPSCNRVMTHIVLLIFINSFDAPGVYKD